MKASQSTGIRTVAVALGERSYEVRIGPGLLMSVGALLRELCSAPTAAIVTDTNVGPLYAEQLLTSLRESGFETRAITVPAGDASKSLAQAAAIYDELAAGRIERRSPVVALGGGMVGDLTGFVAATWLRGVPFVQCPTTIEADVDASVGGKTAVNHSSGKNMIGAFYQPRAVIMDTETLRTLDARDFRAGLAESIKHGAIRDAAFLAWQEQHIEQIFAHDSGVLAQLLERNVQIKADVVAADEREAGLRAILNFGHTIGHAIETVSEFEIEHGQAVAVGMMAAAGISNRMGIFDTGGLERLKRVIEDAGLPTGMPTLDTEKVIQAIKYDKKIAAGKVRFVLPRVIGDVLVTDEVSLSLVREVLAVK
jgi:3-dehydroquinate synthase